MAPVVTGTLAGTSLVSPATSALEDLETSKFPAAPEPEPKTPSRERVVIRRTGKKSSGTMRPPRPQGKRPAVHLAVGIALFIVLVVALMAVIPGNVDGQAASPFQSLFMHPVNSQGNNTMSVAAQEVATATAVTQDGYDAGGGVQYADVVSAPITSSGSSDAADSGSLARFTYGQCTYWANMRYHELTGHWIPWLGNADEWAAGAAADGWVVSGTPNPNGPSIIVLQPYVQGAGAYGHVAIVERVNSDGSVYTSNWNWGGGWTVTTYVTFYPGSGVSFVWY